MCENMLFCSRHAIFLVLGAKQVDDEGVFSHVVSRCLSFSSSSSHSAVLALFRAQFTCFSYCQLFLPLICLTLSLTSSTR